MSEGIEGEGRARIRVAVRVRDDELRRAIGELLALWFPGAVEVVVGSAESADVAPADALILDAPAAGEPALEALRRARSSGFRGAVVVAVPHGAERGPGAGPDRGPVAGARGAEGAEWERLAGALWLAGGEGAGARLAAALGDGVARSAAGGSAPAAPVAALRDELWETRRRLAVGTAALELQHALNNALAALMAEAQLLELEPLIPEHRAAVRRMVELCRRMTQSVRTLAVAAPERPPHPPPRREPAAGERGRGGGGAWFGPHPG